MSSDMHKVMDSRKSNNRHRRGDVRSCYVKSIPKDVFAYQGDFMFVSANDECLPAWLAPFDAEFLGVLMQDKLPGIESEIPIATSGDFEYPLNSDSKSPRIGQALYSCADQEVTTTAVESRAVGRFLHATSGGVLIAINSRMMT